LLGENLPHAEFAAAGNLSSIAASGGQFAPNVSAQIVTLQRSDYQPPALSLEWLEPHNHLVVENTSLVVQTSEFAPATSVRESAFTTASIPRKGADPFHQGRQRASTPKLRHFGLVIRTGSGVHKVYRGAK